MMHQFYLEHRKHWWLFDVTSMFYRCFQCFSTFKPTMFQRKNIKDSLMEHRLIINETSMNRGREITKFRTSMIEFRAPKVRFFSESLPIQLTKVLLQKVDLQGKQRWSRINCQITYFRLVPRLKVNIFWRMPKFRLKKVAEVFFLKFIWLTRSQGKK